MDVLSSRMNLIKPSPTLAIAGKARDLQAQGFDVISLGAGEPDFDTPEYVKRAAVEALANGNTKYTAVDGTNELKDAIIHKFKTENGLAYQRNQISVGAGAKQVLYNLFMVTLNDGDEVVIPAPYWVSYIDIVAISGGKPVVVQCKKEHNFKLDATSLEQSITSRTKWVIINSPNNPTGAVYSKEELSAISQVLAKHPSVHVVTDDIYEHIVYDDIEFCTIAQVAHTSMRERIFTINGLSKAYAMTGWRVGYGAGNPEIIRAMSVIQSQSTTNPNSIAQAASVVALCGDQSFLFERTQTFKSRRDLLMRNLQNTPGLSFIKPAGAFYLFISCEKLLGKETNKGLILKDDVNFSAYLLDDHLVAVVPGSAFGMPGYFRISYATSTEQLIQACKRINQACSELS